MAGFPKVDHTFKTKNELAWKSIQEAEANGMRFDWVGADAEYGRDQDLLLNIAGTGKKFVVAVEFTQMVGQQESERPKPPSSIEKSGAYKVETIWERNQEKAVRLKLREMENGTLLVKSWAKWVWIFPKSCEILIDVWMLVSVRSNGESKYIL